MSHRRTVSDLAGLFARHLDQIPTELASNFCEVTSMSGEVVIKPIGSKSLIAS